MTLLPPLIFGEVLFDCFPDGREVLGGAPFNVAWNLQALGLPPLLISRVGNDPRGKRIIEAMQGWTMTTAGLQVDPRLPTGEVAVTLEAGEPHFTILPAQAYDRIEFCLPDDLISPAFLYHGTLAVRDMTGRKTLSRIKQQVNCPIFVDVNLRDPWWERDLVFTLLEEATWLKLNETELQTLFPTATTVAQGGAMILERFNLDAVFITMGSRGALALTAHGGRCEAAPAAAAQVVDTVGAGDAFASVLLLGLANSWPLATTMARAQEFASAVVGQRGAITTDQTFYDNFRRRWR